MRTEVDSFYVPVWQLVGDSLRFSRPYLPNKCSLCTALLRNHFSDHARRFWLQILWSSFHIFFCLDELYVMSTNTVIHHSVTAVSIKSTHAFANFFFSRFGTLLRILWGRSSQSATKLSGWGFSLPGFSSLNKYIHIDSACAAVNCTLKKSRQTEEMFRFLVHTSLVCIQVEKQLRPQSLCFWFQNFSSLLKPTRVCPRPAQHLLLFRTQSKMCGFTAAIHTYRVKDHGQDRIYPSSPCKCSLNKWHSHRRHLSL